MSASCAGKSDKTESPAGWHVLPVTATGSMNGDLEVEKGFKFPLPSNVVGYSLFKSIGAPDLPNDVSLELRCWITPDDSNEAKLVDQRILDYQETQSWIGWKSFPLNSPASKVSKIRVNVTGLREGTPLTDIIGEVVPYSSSQGFRFCSDRPQTAFYLAQRAAAAAIALIGTVKDMVMIPMQLAFPMFFQCPPLILVPAAVVVFAWHSHGLYAAVQAIALGSIAFAAGLLSLPLTSRHRSPSFLAPLQSSCDSHLPQFLVRCTNVLICQYELP
jgi:hypothetical protein